jgi:hypothetical protein
MQRAALPLGLRACLVAIAELQETMDARWCTQREDCYQGPHASKRQAGGVPLKESRGGKMPSNYCYGKGGLAFIVSRH